MGLTHFGDTDSNHIHSEICMERTTQYVSVSHHQKLNILRNEVLSALCKIYLPWRKLHALKVKVKVTRSCLTLSDPMNYSLPGSSVHGILQVRILEWVFYSLLQGTVPILGLNPGFPHCRWILYQLSQQGNPGILEWVAFPFSRGSLQPRDRTQVSHIAGGFLTSWATREAQEYWSG